MKGAAREHGLPGWRLFSDEDGAALALKELTDNGVFLVTAATLQVDAGGKVHVKELKDMGGGKGAVVGGMAARLADSGFPNADLKARAARLAPGSSVLLLATRPGDWPAIELRLKLKANEIRGGTVDPQMVETLEKDQELVRAALQEADTYAGPVSSYWGSSR